MRARAGNLAPGVRGARRVLHCILQRFGAAVLGRFWYDATVWSRSYLHIGTHLHTYHRHPRRLARAARASACCPFVLLKRCT